LLCPSMALSQLKFKELGEEEPSWEQESLESVKALAAKLKLQTRRPSYLEWEALVRGRPWGARSPGGCGGAEPTPGGGGGAEPSPEGRQDGGVCGFATVEEALEWLRAELVSGTGVSEDLGGPQGRSEGHGGLSGVEQACHQHQEMLDDATFGLEGCEEDSDLLCDIPPRVTFLLSTPLKHIGVTRMNINSRRFSLC
ncbi:F167A protein, partial [Origma solitaria]|nr:F167A protein [Origma solitaria]